MTPIPVRIQIRRIPALDLYSVEVDDLTEAGLQPFMTSRDLLIKFRQELKMPNHKARLTAVPGSKGTVEFVGGGPQATRLIDYLDMILE